MLSIWTGPRGIPLAERAGTTRQFANGATIFLTSRMLRSWNGGAVMSGSFIAAGWLARFWLAFF